MYQVIKKAVNNHTKNLIIMTTIEAVKKLEAMEKAISKLEKIDVNSEKAPYGFWIKRNNALNKVINEHHNFLRLLWDAGIFV